MPINNRNNEAARGLSEFNNTKIEIARADQMVIGQQNRENKIFRAYTVAKEMWNSAVDPDDKNRWYNSMNTWTYSTTYPLCLLFHLNQPLLPSPIINRTPPLLNLLHPTPNPPQENPHHPRSKHNHPQASLQPKLATHSSRRRLYSRRRNVSPMKSSLWGNFWAKRGEAVYRNRILMMKHSREKLPKKLNNKEVIKVYHIIYCLHAL